VTPLHVICYGPKRGAEALPELLAAHRDTLGRVIEVRYQSDAAAPAIEGATRVLVEDPGPMRVVETAACSGAKREGLSNSLRQFTMLRAAMARLTETREDEALLIVRSDLDISDERRFRNFLQSATTRIASGRLRFVRLTVNSISPLSFTGHKLHGSDWLVVTRVGAARRLFDFDPATFAAGRYGRFSWSRKGDFCFGGLTAEELFNVAAYLPIKGMAADSLNPFVIPWRPAIRFLYDNWFVSPAEAGAGLAKWEYLYRPGLRAPQPFGRGLIATLRRTAAWILFWSALVPASRGPFTIKLLAKGLLSWTVNLLRFPALSLWEYLPSRTVARHS
jgi:hypothetical protein